MDREGMISYKGGKLVMDKMEKLRTDRSQAPLVGTVPCGELTYEEENVECVATLPTAIFGAGPFYILHAVGDSMEDEGMARQQMKASYSRRMLLQILWMIAAIAAPCFQFVAGLVPLLFPSLGLKLLTVTGKLNT